MPKTIDSLVEDIHNVLLEGVEDGELFDHAVAGLANDLAVVFKQRLGRGAEAPRVGPDGRGTLRMSKIGVPCNRQLYYYVNNQEEATPLRPEAKMKFLFGDILEEVLLFLAELAGHKVEGRQTVLEIAGIKGRRDAVIDGVVVDTKSASSRSFDKFKSHGLSKDDPFGYQDQLQSYLRASQEDELVTDKDRAAFFVVDKQLGHLCLDVHEKKDFPYEEWYEYKKRLVDLPEPPTRGFHPVPEGKSGNMKLGVNCSYCDYKHKCWPTLRTFLYSNRPMDLVHIERVPNVPELRKDQAIEETEEAASEDRNQDGS